MATVVLLYLVSTLSSLVISDIIQYYEMNTTIPNEWDKTGTVNTYTSAEPNCPDNKNYCWSIQHSSTLTLTPISTVGYHTISFTYAVSAYNLNGQDRCIIQYTTDGTTLPSNYQNIITYTNNIVTDTGIFSGWSTAADDNANGISIQLESSGTGQECYFNHFIIAGTKITAQPTLTPTLNPSLATTSTPSFTPSFTPTFTTTNPLTTSIPAPTLSILTSTFTTVSPSTPTTGISTPTMSTLTPNYTPTQSPGDEELFEEFSPWEWPFSVPSIIIVYVVIAWFILFCCLRGWLMKLLLMVYGKMYESRVVGKTVTYHRKGGTRFFIQYELCGTIRKKQVAASAFNELQEQMPIMIKYDPFCPTYNHKVYAYHNGWLVCLWVLCIYLCMGGIAVAVLFGLDILNTDKIQKAQNATEKGATNYYQEEGQNYIYYNPQLLAYSICFGMFLCLLCIGCQCICGNHCGKGKADLVDYSQVEQAQNIENNQMVQAQMVHVPVVYQVAPDPNQANHAQAPSIIYIQPQPNVAQPIELAESVIYMQDQPSAPQAIEPDEYVPIVAIDTVEGNESNVNQEYFE